MKEKSIVALTLLLITSLKLWSQPLTERNKPFTYKGLFDTVFDHLGNKYALKDLQLNSPHPFSDKVTVAAPSTGKTIGGPQTINAAPSQSCSAGKFDLYFATGGFFDNNIPAQNVICMLFSDLSNFIVSGFSQRINIYCDKTSSSQGPNVLGSASAINLCPAFPNNPNPGIVHNVIQKALITGQNPFNNVPLMAFSTANNFYYGYVNVNPNKPWYINTTGTPAQGANDNDLYTLLLHEVTHALGFYSLISSTGISQLGAGNNYYSVFDQYLFKPTNPPTPLIKGTVPACAASNLTFQGPLSAIQPGGPCIPDFTSCNSAVTYIGGVTVKIYTPNCWEQGSSLSHFEDMCTVPAGYAPPCGGPNNNTYYVMSNANAPGPCFQKRHLTKEERIVLCDLGYKVKGVYTSAAAGATYNYNTGTCPGTNVWGTNDGLIPNGFSFATAACGTSYTINKSTISSNDAPGSTLTCPEVVYGSATIANNPGNIVISAASGAGLVIIKYIPKIGTKSGNETYIFVYFMPCNQCTPVNPCNMIQNQGFENLVAGACGGPVEFNMFGTGPVLGCWGVYDEYPDLVSRNCTTPAMPSGYGPYNLGINTWGTTPPINSFVPTVNGQPNNRIIEMGALMFGGQNGNHWNQSIKNALGSPLINGQTYRIGFWVWNRSGPAVGGGWNMGSPPSPAVVSIATAPTFATFGTNFPAGLNIATDFTVPVTPGWTYVSKTFLFNPGSNHNTLIMGIDAVKTDALGLLPPNNAVICVFDEVSLEPVSANPVNFLLPMSTICTGTSILNLNQYVTPIPGVFAGTGVTFSGGKYHFNANLSLPAGNYPISFTYTLSNGCVKVLWQNVSIINGAPLALTVNGSTTICTNAPVSVNLSASATPAANVTYFWQPGNIPAQNITVNPSITQVYTVTASSPASCPVKMTVTVTVSPPPAVAIVPTNPVLCAGQPNTLTATGAANYVWSPSAPGNGNNIIWPVVAGTYTVTGTAANGCTNTAMLTVINGPLVIPTASDATLCTNAGTSTLITANSSFMTGPVSYVWQQPSGPNMPWQSINASVAGVYTVTASSPAGCPSTTTMNLSITANCCSQSTTGLTPITGLAGSFANTSYFLGSSITLTNSTFFQNAEVWIMPNVQITVPNGFVLDLDNTHLFACGINMWQGIVVQDGGRITTSNTKRANSLIEDAVVGIDLGGISATNSSPLPPIDIQRVIFNKNYTGIKIWNSDPTLNQLALGITGCVFASRDMTFTTFPTALSWPSSDMVNATDLRFAAAGATTALAPPYTNVNLYAPANLKQPYANQPAHIGIKIENIGDPMGFLPTPGVDIGVTYPSPHTTNDFNLFEGIDIGIDVLDASLRTSNNVFQSLQNFSGLDGVGINHAINTIMNARLDFSSSNSLDDGNRFWDCVTGVRANNVYELFVKHSLFRSTHTAPNALFTWPAAGDNGIEYETNRFNSTIVESEFENLKNGIVMKTPLPTIPYDMTGSNNTPGIYAKYLDIERNFFGAVETSTTAYMANTNEYMGEAIRLETPNTAGWTTAGIGFVISNKIDRSFRGIHVNSMNDFPLAIGGNSVYIEDDYTFGSPQYGYGIQVMLNQDNLSITENTLYANGTINPSITLVHCRNNNGAGGTGNFISNGNGSPFISCNFLKDSYYAFNFEGPNMNTTWQGNSMLDHWAGLVLSNGGVIGPQGSPAFGCSNKWQGINWNGPGWQTYCINSNGSSSPLFVVNPTTYSPSANSGWGGFTPYTPADFPPATTELINDCINTMFLPVPSLRAATSISNAPGTDNNWSIEVYPNPSAGKINIITSVATEQLKLRAIDLAGKIVVSRIIVTKGNQAQTDLDLQKGIYLLEIESDGGKITRKKLIIE